MRSEWAGGSREGAGARLEGAGHAVMESDDAWQACKQMPKALSTAHPRSLTRGLPLGAAAGVCLPDLQHPLLRVEGAAQQADDLAAAAAGGMGG